MDLVNKTLLENSNLEKSIEESLKSTGSDSEDMGMPERIYSSTW